MGMADLHKTKMLPTYPGCSPAGKARAGQAPAWERGQQQAGFSLVEMVITIVIASILSVGVVGFIQNTTQGYVQTAARNQLSSAGRTAIDRLALELHNALPNSIRTTAASPGTGDQCIEFVPVLAATSYIDPAFRPAPAASSFNVVGFVPDLSGLSGVYASIYGHNTAAVYDPASLSPGATGAIVAVNQISDVGSGVNQLDTPDHRFARRSPTQRLFLSAQPVSFCVSGTSLYRYSGYGFQSSQPTLASLPATTGAGRYLVSDSISNAGIATFNYVAASRLRNAVLQIQLNFSADGESVLLNHEVMLQNVP